MTYRLDLIGQRFGRLVVMEKMQETQERYALWRCQCDCGGEIFVNTKRLKRKTVTNCGCIPKTTAQNGPIAEDLTGRRFGELTVLHRTQNYRGRTCWVCRCSCGNLHTSTAHELKQGKCISCGGKQHRIGRGVANISGRRFGRLTALYTINKRDEKGSVYWHCRCICGNEVDITEDRLVHGNYKSCGCLREEIQKNVSNQLHRIDNTCLEYLEGRRSQSNNTSGFRGVYVTPSGRFRVSIGFKKSHFYVGTYDSFQEAVQARLEVEELIHGGFVKAYYVWNAQCQADPAWAKETPLIFDVTKRDGSFEVITNINYDT